MIGKGRTRLLFFRALPLALLAALPAKAWEPELHQAFTRAAMRLSAAAEARVPAEHRDVLFREVGAADLMDRDCRYHVSDTGTKDPALLAEQTLAMLTGPNAAAMKPYQRAQLVGRYLHYAMDAVAPASMRQQNSPKLVNLFSNRDLVFWRESRPLTGPLAAALHKRAQDMLWPNVKEEAGYGMILRCIVNTLADTILLLPAPPEAAAVRDEGPVFFLVNRQDNGVAGKATSGHYESATSLNYTSTSYGPYTRESWGPSQQWVAGTKGGGDSFSKLNLMDRRGTQLVELVAHQEGDRIVLRGLLFNNNELCAEGVDLKAGDWKAPIPDTMPPHSLRAFEVSAPPDFFNRRVSSSTKAAQCPGLKIPSGTLSASRRVVIGLAGQVPNFDYSTAAVEISPGAQRSVNNLSPR